ncbi:unnamed protein product [Larinioides sclopetarius]|uniref:Ionotropic glutamate receptor L-glutamate and glycine-binding domain-containing protein n=1 Tax=Larinioides sclopetarius TaxID=280406 RepID=A0AAV2BVY1_9ARAC
MPKELKSNPPRNVVSKLAEGENVPFISTPEKDFLEVRDFVTAIKIIKETLKGFPNFIEWPPWSLIIPDGNGSRLDGVLKDVLGALSYSLKYHFEIQLQADHQYGSLQADGNFSGMLGALQQKEHIPLCQALLLAGVAGTSNDHPWPGTCYGSHLQRDCRRRLEG